MFYHISVTYDAQRNLSQYSTSLNIAEGGSYWFNTVLPISLFVMFIPNAAKILFLLISLVIGLVFIVYLIWICKALSLFFLTCVNAIHQTALMHVCFYWWIIALSETTYAARICNPLPDLAMVERLVNINTDVAARWKFLRWTL